MATREQAEFYDNFIDHFKAQMNNGRNQNFRAWTKKWIFKPAKVLDAGCAFGYNSEYLTQIGCEVHGIDISSQCIMLARKKYPHGKWHCGDITDGFNPGPDVKDFDFVLLSDVVEHIPKERHGIFFQRLGEMTKPGAALIASVPNPENHELAQQQTYQPVEEKIEMHELLKSMAAGSFTRVVSMFLLEGLYYRTVVQKVNG
jgi:2-polyprenyl-3-methyl-5-hydroxy-6-metoxy-1,4-benzoquinol methylase